MRDTDTTNVLLVATGNYNMMTTEIQNNINQTTCAYIMRCSIYHIHLYHGVRDIRRTQTTDFTFHGNSKVLNFKSATVEV